MKRLLALALTVIAVLCLLPALAAASTRTDCLADHVCVTGSGRSLISDGQEATLQRQIGSDDIYLAVAPSGASGYNSAMNQVVGDLGGHERFTVGYLDSRLMHFGAVSREMLPSRAAADIATRTVAEHQGDQNVFAALTDFVGDVQHEAGSGSAAAADSGPSHVLRNVLIALSIVLALVLLGFFLIARPARDRRRRELREAKSAAQDDLIALSGGLTDRRADVAVQGSPEAAQEQAEALNAYERGTAAMDAARRASDMGAVSRAIAEGQYRLACADALAAGRPRPDRRPPCFFDPRHGMSVSDGYWTPAAGGGRAVPVCIACAHKLEQGIEPDMRQVEVAGAPVSYVNAGFAPAYWGGFGFGPGLFTGFLLGHAFTPYIFADPSYYSGDGDYGGGAPDGGDFGGGDFGGGDFGGGDFGGGDF